MPFSELFPISGAWWIDLAVIVLAAILLLYLARQTAHDIFLGTSRALASSLRLTTQALLSWSRQLESGARRAALLLITDHQQRLAVREIEQLRTEVAHALKHYPGLQKNITDSIQRIRDDYEADPADPEPPSTWGKLIEKIAGIREKADPALQDSLEAVRESIEKVGRQLSDQHARHLRSAAGTLSSLRPHWGRIAENLERLDARLERVETGLERSGRLIRRFETLQNQRRTLSARFRSWLALQFTVGTFLLGVAGLILLVNFHLILTPMQESVGTQATTGPFLTAPLIAVTLVLAQLSLAIVITDTAGLTRLIAPIGRMRPLLRRCSLGLASLLLLLLAASEASLAFMRDSIVLESEWLARELDEGIARGSPELRWLPSLAQMGMGFVLPLALVALIPAIESFFQTARVVLLLSLAWLARLLGTITRLLARLISSAGHLLAYVYDLIIVIPLSLDRRFRRHEPNLDKGEEK